MWFGDAKRGREEVAGLLVVGSETPDLEKSFSELYRTAVLPPLMEQGHMEQKILRHYLVLHDDSTSDEAAFMRYISSCLSLTRFAPTVSCVFMAVRR